MSQDWARALRFAVLRLGIRPADFWALTLWEWRALTGGAAQPGDVLQRSGLEALLGRYPAYASTLTNTTETDNDP